MRLADGGSSELARAEAENDGQCLPHDGKTVAVLAAFDWQRADIRIAGVHLS